MKNESKTMLTHLKPKTEEQVRSTLARMTIPELEAAADRAKGVLMLVEMFGIGSIYADPTIDVPLLRAQLKALRRAILEKEKK